jgi:S-formylglutathione hydrolase FrmB
MKKILLGASLFLMALFVQAASVDTLSIYSNSMHRPVKTVVVLPAAYQQNSTMKFPVIYLLHGAFGSYNNWITRVPHIQQLADQYKIMIVCPDGGYTSWYYDSPIDTTYRFETFVGTEVPAYMDTHYRTIADRKGRAITGLSMGGHGGIFLGFRHADRFSAVGSMSGALNSTIITKGYGVEKRLGDTAANREYWQNWSALKVVEQYPKDSLNILIDCGTEDMVIGMNRAMHEKLLKLKIPHEYIERPGKHDWNYWNTAIDTQLFFFRRHFDTMLKP